MLIYWHLEFDIHTKAKNPPIIVVNSFRHVEIDEYLDFINEHNSPENGYKKA